MGLAYSRPSKQNKTHPFRTPNHSPNLHDGEEPPFPTSSLCGLIFGSSKKQPTDSPYPKISIYRKPPNPKKSTPLPNRPNPPLHQPNPPPHPPPTQDPFSQESPPARSYLYDGIRRPPSDPNASHSGSEEGSVISQHSSSPLSYLSQDTPPARSYLYDGRARPVDTRTYASDPKPTTPPPLTYLYDGLKPRPQQQLDRGA